MLINMQKLPKVIIKSKGQSLSQYEINQLNESANELQPDKIAPNSTEELDLIVSGKLTQFYKELCDLDVAFHICAILPKSKEPRSLYRIAKLETPDDQPNYNAMTGKICWALYCFLSYSRFLHHLASLGYIEIKKDIEKDKL